MKILFACDLDNTLIYSHKHKKNGDICVERLDGREQGFFLPECEKPLREIISRAEFVPVTTRSVEQYSRIGWIEGLSPEFAVCTNGAVLLENGGRVSDWCGEYSRMIEPYRSELRALGERFSEDKRFIRCRMVDDSYLFVYCDKDVPPEETARELSQECSLNVSASGKKIYFLPKEVNKGEAARRLKSRLGADIVISAGDSEIDVSMLCASDFAVFPYELSEAVRAPETAVFSGDGSFPKFVTDSVLGFIRRL